MRSNQSKQSCCRLRVGTPGRRRGAVAAQVAMCLTTLVGFTALTVDVGHMYNVRAELQRTADVSALTAAQELGDFLTGNAKVNATAMAQAFAQINTVLGDGVELEADGVNKDITFGRAWIDEQTGRYVFEPDENEIFPNAVRVRARKTAPLFFAGIFGKTSKDLSAQATAVLTPRDIAFVLDLSTSHNDDSSLRSYKNTEIANKDVYDYLADVESALDPQTDGLGFQSQVGLTDNGDGTTTITVDLTSVSTAKALSHVTFGIPQSSQELAGNTGLVVGGNYENPELGEDPTSGVSGIKWNSIGDGLGEDGVVDTHTFSFSVLTDDLSQIQLSVATKAGPVADTSVSYNLNPKVNIGNLTDWGTETTGPGWDFANDSGLVKLGKNQTWSMTSEWVSQEATSRGYAAYTADEMAIINAPQIQYGETSEWTSDYRRRVRVALGIDVWSGDANGNGLIDSSEVTNMVDYPNQSTNPDTLSKKVGGSWDSFIDYVRDSNSSMAKYSPYSQLYGDPGLQYRYGLKTFVDYLQEKKYGQYQSPGLAGSPQQPMGAVADAVKESFKIIEELQGGDLVGIASYATVGYGPSDKPDNMSWLTEVDTSAQRQALQGLINELQPGMWTTNTNVAQGIDKGVDVLFDSTKARPNAAKVLVLLTDGIANQVRQNPSYWNTYEAKQDAIEAADEARNQGVRIYTISVGANADQDLMKRIADASYDSSYPDYVVEQHFHAEGAVEDYKAELQEIFKQLGGARPVVLIE